MESCKLSEVPWIGGAHGSGEKFNFEHASVCAVYRAGELTLIEYGRNEVLGSCLTEHMSPHLVSIRINERPPSVEELVAKGRDLSAAVSISHAIAALGGRTAAEVPDKEIKSSLAVEAEASRANKKLAYLIDEQTICVHDLITGTPIASVAHDSRVDWLELNARGSLLLFRDKRRRLHLFDVFACVATWLLGEIFGLTREPGMVVDGVVVLQEQEDAATRALLLCAVGPSIRRRRRTKPLIALCVV